MTRSLLEAIEAVCNVDVDAVDPAVAKAMPFKPHNQTSNQVICSDMMVQPKYQDLLTSMVRKYGEQGWEEMVQFCANNLENVTNRVLVQVSPSRVYDKDKVLEQCYAYDRAFRDAGVSRDRYAIKISATGPAMVAAAQLNREGIRTLGTSIFSLPQAIAASQAGCLYISPYFNEVAAYSDDSLMHKGSDPAMTHPMAPRLIHILEAYAQLYEETGKEQPIIVIASNANIGEIIATAELGCQHITILAHHMRELQETPLDSPSMAKYPFLQDLPSKKQAPYYAKLKTAERLRGHSTSDPMAGPGWNGKLADIHTDYLADNGKALSEAMTADEVVVKKMRDVLGAFIGGDAKAKAAIEQEVAKLRAN
ncbi:aldolase [Aspergillus sclerotiicarbonarius CBS 121057]|uniref:Aldolase n=1 Tax=Aspergillus sclerotiicarbonarius (strain CBS 121057 / IBT 28362) TaxID=1448318 RepID=A0A319E3P2_ASPSB|nr:aldolase [Aspergillus sclerotiicarbonarius CBS 121057]